MEEIVKARLEELKKEREDFLVNVEKSMLAYDIAIGELQNLLIKNSQIKIEASNSLPST
jgi:hypothetical protein